MKSHAPLIPLAAPDAESDTDQAEYTRLLAMYEGSFRNLSEGEVIKGTVLKVSSSEVVVDVGYKSEGVIALSEFIDENGDVTVRPGDTVDVLLERTEDREGHIVLSREKAEKMKIWDDVEQAYIDRKVVIGRVIERIKGGLAVDIGVRRVPARFSDRCAAGPQPGLAPRAGAPDAGDQGQQEAREYRPFSESAS